MGIGVVILEALSLTAGAWHERQRSDSGVPGIHTQRCSWRCVPETSASRWVLELSTCIQRTGSGYAKVSVDKRPPASGHGAGNVLTVKLQDAN